MKETAEMSICPACVLALANDRNAKHTPGPWTLAKNGTIYARNFDKTIVNFGEASSPEEQANVTLMAAAPDLLAACRAASISLIGDEDYAKHRDLFKTLDAAIAKATGGAHMHAGRSRPVHQAQMTIQSSVLSRESLVKKLRRCADGIAADPEIAVYVIDDMEDEEGFADMSSGHCQLLR